MSGSKATYLLSILAGVCIGALAAGLVGFSPRSRGKTGIYREWDKLNLVLKSVSDNYVDSIAYGDVSEAAIAEILSKLDPHSVYMRPEDLADSESDLAGNFDGIGIRFTVPEDTAIVTEVIRGGPAESAGLQVEDRIVRVDSIDIAGVGYPQDSMVRRMKGPAGTMVKVTVLRGKELKPFDIKRGKIPVHCVIASFMLNDTTGYIKLDKFSRTTVMEFAVAGSELLESGMKKLVLDLRDNTGGYFDQALTLSNMFLPEDADIVYMEGLHRKRESYKANGKGTFVDMPLVVLINENSASSSEIFAGAIQDNDRGVIIGHRSFGKGLVQEPFYFTDGSGIRLTVARFYTPSGRCIQKPYSEGTEEYVTDIYKRYLSGELFEADSIKVNTDSAYHTAGGRTVYGGGGIIPDVFVPADTSAEYVAAVKKLLPRYARMTDQDFYREYVRIDNAVKEALKPHEIGKQ